MHRVGRPQLARLNNESQKARSQRQEKERGAQPSSNTRGHRLDVNTVQLSGCTVQVNAWRGKIEQTNPREKKSTRAKIAPVRQTAQHIRSNVYPGRTFSAGLPESQVERCSSEKNAVRNGAARLGDVVCSKPVRWDLDDQAGHGQASDQARQIFVEQQHV